MTRTLIAAGPVVVSVGLGLAAVHWFPPRRLGVDPWTWLLIEVLCATAILVLATRVARSLVPLTTLLRLTLYFPDRAPSRLAVAVRHYSPSVLHGRRRGLHPSDEHSCKRALPAGAACEELAPAALVGRRRLTPPCCTSCGARHPALTPVPLGARHRPHRMRVGCGGATVMR